MTVESTLPDPGAVSEPAAVFAGLAEMIYADTDFPQVYQAICTAAPLLVTGCDHASLMVRIGDRFITAAANDDIAEQIDRFEREFCDGPCVDAIEHESAQLDTDLAADSQWPRLAARVLAETPVRGVAGIRLAVGGNKRGALNFFSNTAGALTAESVDEGIILASFTSVALTAVHHRQEAHTLRAGLDSNREIGKATGLMMAFHEIGDAAAFDLLRKTSQDMNIKIGKVARMILDHHNNR